VQAPYEDYIDDVKDMFYGKVGCVLDQCPRYDMKILFGDFNGIVGREDILKLTIGNGSSHETSNDNGVRVVNFATSKNLVVKSTMFPHCSICKYTWTSPDGKTHNHIDHVLIHKQAAGIISKTLVSRLKSPSFFLMLPDIWNK
jgi:hypothetical protein